MSISLIINSYQQKKKEKKKKDRSISGSPISADGSDVPVKEPASDDQAMSESELESRRQALLAQLAQAEPMDD